MANIKNWLLAAESHYGEPILSVVVGIHDKRRYVRGSLPLEDENVLLSREAALHKLDVEFYGGFGCAECFPIFAWTESRVFFINEYDGSTNLSWVPRNPTAVETEFSGLAAYSGDDD